MTHGERAKYRADLIRDVTEAVRAELRLELILAGVVDTSWHVPSEERTELAARLRRIADELDPPERNDDLQF